MRWGGPKGKDPGLGIVSYGIWNLTYCINLKDPTHTHTLSWDLFSYLQSEGIELCPF